VTAAPPVPPAATRAPRPARALHYAGSRRWLVPWWGALPGWSYAGLFGAAAALALFLKPVAYRAFAYFQF